MTPVKKGFAYAMTSMLLLLLVVTTGSRAFTTDDTNTNPDLSLAEKTWLARHPEIVLAPAENLYPFEFFDENGNYRGVAADYITLIEKRTGIRFRIARTGTAEDRYAKIAAGEVDVVNTEGISPQVTDYMLLARPHIIMPGVIVSNRKFTNLDELGGKKVAVSSSERWGSYIKRNYPAVQLVYVENIASGLELIPTGNVDALVSDMATTSYYIHREGLTEIQVVGKVGKNIKLGIATRKDWPELNGILEKTLAGISASDKDKIYRQWIHRKKTSIVDSETFLTIILTTLSGILFTLVTIILWNQTLKKQVLQRTASLDKELRLRHAAEIELKETQLQLINAEKMETIGRLAAGIAHEIKNPLAVIMLGLDYISEKTKGKDSYNEVLSDMGNAAQRASLAANSLLDFSRESEFEIHNSNLNDIIEKSLQLVRHELRQHNIKLVKALDGQLPEIPLDPRKMEQVFINLFMNAIQAMRKNGTLYVSTGFAGSAHTYNTECKPVTDAGTGSEFIIAEVGDTGPGIEEAILDRVFDPFFTTKKREEGTGLGLSITRNIVDLHQGTIEITNRDPTGILARITLKQKDE